MKSTNATGTGTAPGSAASGTSSAPTNNNNSRTANNRISLLERNQSLVVQGFILNLIYLVGAISMLSFGVLELNGRERDAAALVTYIIGFILMFLNALGEFVIDLSNPEEQRNVRHGRYSIRKHYNLAISTIFVIGTVLDLVAFFLWIERKFEEEHYVLYAASHAWLVSGILALVGEPPSTIITCFVGEGGEGEDTSNVMEGLDDVGNILFLIGCIIDCLVRYIDSEFDTGSPPDPIARLEFSSAPIFMISASCYSIADGLRVKKMRSKS